MYKRYVIIFVILSIIQLSFAQTKKNGTSTLNGSTIKGNISYYAGKYIRIYQPYLDTLILIDSVKTDDKGGFVYSFACKQYSLYKFVMPYNQWFYVLNDGNLVKLKTIYRFHAFENIAVDSLVVMESENNKVLYAFERLNKQWNIARYYLLQLARLYPISDPFHTSIEYEYLKRYQNIDKYVKKNFKKAKIQLAMKVALAYYQPINPDWRQPDVWRDSIIANHYFDYFNPTDSFYRNTEILPEKLHIWLELRLNNSPTSMESPSQKEEKTKQAADEWLQRVQSNEEIFEWSLQFIFKYFEKRMQYDALYYIYDKYVQSRLIDCEPPLAYKRLHEKISQLKNIQVGNYAPDILIYNRLSMYGLQADYTLLLFWATWCPHCREEVPRIKNAVDEINRELLQQSKRMQVIAISLDTNKVEWEKFVNENHLGIFINYSEFQGWQSPTAKLYNVYATPTVFLLDKEKKKY